jgi:hypothetical protein
MAWIPAKLPESTIASLAEEQKGRIVAVQQIGSRAIADAL